MLVAFSLLLEPGDEVILGAPHYACYPNFIRYCGGVPVVVQTRADDGWRLDPEAVRRQIIQRGLQVGHRIPFGFGHLVDRCGRLACHRLGRLITAFQAIAVPVVNRRTFCGFKENCGRTVLLGRPAVRGRLHANDN